MALRRFLRRAGQFLRHDVSGAGAVEFVMVAPVLLILLLGGSELGVALTVNRKVESAAGAAADLASQSTALNDADFRKLMSIARGTIAPYPLASLQMRLTQIRIDKSGKGTVDWSCATTGYSKLPKGEPVTMPPEMSASAKALFDNMLVIYQNDPKEAIYIVRGEARYSMKPITGEVFTDMFTMSGETYVQPRYSDLVESSTEGCTTFSF